jgi:hypothetical protein
MKLVMKVYDDVLVSLRCYSDNHGLGGFYNKYFSHSFGGWEIQDRGLVGLVPDEGMLPGLQMIAFLYSHMEECRE